MKGPKGKHAWTVTVGEKGQFVVPKEARELFDIKPGDTLLLLGDDRKGLAIPPKGQLTELISRIFDTSDDEGPGEGK
jgi:AbrB family looped-hinge helix DNA binding protein